MSSYRNHKFLCSIKKEISNLPWEMWDNSDLKNPDVYDKKRKELICRVMHLDFKLQGFVNKKYGNSNLLNELNSYSFFPTDCMYDTFHVENNNVWKRGKKAYLCFVDKLLDFEEAEKIIESEGVVCLISKVLMLFAVVLVSAGILFLDYIADDVIFPCNLILKYRLIALFVIIDIMANILWTKNWRDLLPFSTTILGAILGSIS